MQLQQNTTKNQTRSTSLQSFSEPNVAITIVFLIDESLRHKNVKIVLSAVKTFHSPVLLDQVQDADIIS